MPGTQPTPRKNTLILLYVNSRPTDAQGNRIPLTNGNIKDYVFFTDTSCDVTNDVGNNVDNYESNVEKGGTATWVGAVSNHTTAPRDYVIITGVVESDGSSGISPPVSLPAPGYGNHVQATVTGNKNDIVDYTINFNVWHVEVDGSKTFVSLSIDPKLKIH